MGIYIFIYYVILNNIEDDPLIDMFFDEEDTKYGRTFVKPYMEYIQQSRIEDILRKHVLNESTLVNYLGFKLFLDYEVLFRQKDESFGDKWV